MVTTIGTNYRALGGDIVKDSYDRFTQQLSVVDDDTLQTLARVSTNILLTDDPLSATGTASVSTVEVPYKRIKPVVSDLP